MKSRLALVAAAAALSLTLAGCGATSGGGGSASGTLEVQTDMAVGTSELTALKAIAAEFEKKNPDTKLNLVPGDTNYEANIKVRLASGNIPDIWMTHGWSLLRYSSFLTPLQDEAWAKNLSPALAPAMKNDKGQIFAMPTNIDISGIIYNKDVLSKAGFSADDITSWNAFMTASKAIKADGASPIYVGGKAMAGALADRILPGAFGDADLKKMSSGTFVTDKYTDMLALIASWSKAGLFNPDYSSATTTDMSKALAQGQAGFVMGPSSLADDALQYNPKANLGFMPIPSVDGSPAYLVGGERTAFGISKTTKDPEGAKAFLAFLAQPENVTAMAKASASPPGLTDATMSAGALSDSFDTYVTKDKTPMVPYFDRVYLPDGSWNAVGATADSVITKQSSADAAAAQMKSTFTSLYGQGK